MVGLLVGGAVAAWIAWRLPLLAILAAIATLAVTPEAVDGSEFLDLTWTIQHWAIAGAFAICGLKLGLRLRVPWPAVAIVVAAVLTALFGRLYPGLGVERWLGGLGLLTLPWLLSNVVLPRDFRRPIAITIGSLGIISVLAGVGLGLGLAQFAPGYQGWGWNLRLIGAVNDPGLLSILGFTGFVVSTNEYARKGGYLPATLAIANLAIILMSGTRMALFATGMFAALYLYRCVSLRSRIKANPRSAVLAAVAVLVVLALVLPTQLSRLQLGDSFDDSSRLTIWTLYWEEFLVSPMVGRGPEAHNLAGHYSLPFYRRTTHNTYLTILVDFGVMGMFLLVVALVRWTRELARTLAPDDLAFLHAVIPSLMAFGITETVLSAPQALPMFVYLAVIQWSRRRSRRRSRRPTGHDPLDEALRASSRREAPSGSDRERESAPQSGYR